MTYRHDRRLPELYELAREKLLRATRDGQIRFGDGKHIRKELDELRAEVQGWIGPTPEQAEAIATLEARLDDFTPSKEVGISLREIGFDTLELSKEPGKDPVVCYVRELKKNTGILTDQDIVTGELTLCFYQVGAMEDFKSTYKKLESHLSSPHYLRSLVKHGMYGTLIGGCISAISTLRPFGRFAENWDTYILIGIGVGAITGALFGYFEEKRFRGVNMQQILNYPQERAAYFNDAKIASGKEALLFATTPPYGVQEEMKFRVEEVKATENGLSEEQEVEVPVIQEVVKRG